MHVQHQFLHTANHCHSLIPSTAEGHPPLKTGNASLSYHHTQTPFRKHRAAHTRQRQCHTLSLTRLDRAHDHTVPLHIPHPFLKSLATQLPIRTRDEQSQRRTSAPRARVSLDKRSVHHEAYEMTVARVFSSCFASAEAFTCANKRSPFTAAKKHRRRTLAIRTYVLD